MGNSDSKYVFRQRVKQLVTRPIPAGDHDFWKLLFISQLSVEDVFALVQPRDVRKLRQRQPINLATLIFKSIEQLFLFVQDRRSDFTSARNSLRILTRILPFVFENGQYEDEEEEAAEEELADNMDEAMPVVISPSLPEGYDFVENFFWQNKMYGIDGREVTYNELGDEVLLTPLGQLLMRLLLEVCFYTGFTLVPSKRFASEPKSMDGYPFLDPRLLWAGGIASADPGTSSSASIEWNRIDVLRCILSCLTGSLYETDALKLNKFLNCFTTELAAPSVTLCYSLLNTVMSYNPSGILPYTSYLGAPRSTLVDVSLHVLLTALDYGYFTRNNENESGESGTHAFWGVIKNMNKDADLEFIFQGFVNLLGNHLNAANTFLPMSQKTIECHAELLLLLWKLIDVNKTFRVKICKKMDITELLLPLLYCIYESQADQSRYGVLQVTTFIILSLSGERDFGVALNKPFTSTVPMQLPLFTGNHADLLVIVFHQLIFLNKPWVKSLYDCLLTILCNISPYCKSMSMVSANKLISLFEIFSLPKVLTKGDGKNVSNVVLLLEFMNNVIQYQYEGNVHLVYAIIRQKKLFQRLADLVRAPSEDTEEANQPQLPSHVRDQIPISTIMRTLLVLTPEMESFCDKNKGASEQEVLKFLQNTTLVGLLPVPHPILIRRFESHPHTHAWVTTWAWGTIYLRNLNPPLLDANSIKLFRISSQTKSKDGKDGANGS